ncbi:MAG: hypothetical protein K5769_07110 [Pseudobutyrivibrio sp.]|nr:hypothetical protein [Pseudobutyrivibrio sp.]
MNLINCTTNFRYSVVSKLVMLGDGDGGSYTGAIDKLKDVICNIGTALGVIMLAYGGIKFALAFQKMDQQGEHQAVFSIVSGAVLMGLSAVITALGG